MRAPLRSEAARVKSYRMAAEARCWAVNSKLTGDSVDTSGWVLSVALLLVCASKDHGYGVEVADARWRGDIQKCL